MRFASLLGSAVALCLAGRAAIFNDASGQRSRRVDPEDYRFLVRSESSEQ